MFLAACGGGDDATDNEDKKSAKQEINALESQPIPAMDSVMAQDTVSFTTMEQRNGRVISSRPQTATVSSMADGKPEVSEGLKNLYL